MMTSSNGNIYRVTSPLWGESSGHRWIHLTKASDAEPWCCLWTTPEQTDEQTIETPVIWDAFALIMRSPCDWPPHNIVFRASTRHDEYQCLSKSQPLGADRVCLHRDGRDVVCHRETLRLFCLWLHIHVGHLMMTPWHETHPVPLALCVGNPLVPLGPLWGGLIGHWWFHLTKGQRCRALLIRCF